MSRSPFAGGRRRGQNARFGGQPLSANPYRPRKDAGPKSLRMTQQWRDAWREGYLATDQQDVVAEAERRKA